MNEQLKKELNYLFEKLDGMDYTAEEYGVLLDRIKAIKEIEKMELDIDTNTKKAIIDRMRSAQEVERADLDSKESKKKRIIDTSIKVLDISSKVAIGLGAVIIAKNKEAELVKPLFEQALEFETEGTFTSLMSRGVANEIVKNI